MDPYNMCTEVLFRKGFGADQRTVGQYRSGIEPIPDGLIRFDPDLLLLSLSDSRPGLLRSCKLLGIQYEELGYSEETAEPFDENFPLPTTPFWFRHDVGRKNRNRRPDHCRDELMGDIQASTALEGIFAFAHHPTIVKDEHVIDLPRTVHRTFRVHCACLGVWGGQAKLSLLRSSGVAVLDYGTLCVRRK